MAVVDLVGNRVHGIILNQSNGKPVQNLVIALYDWDLEKFNEAPQRYQSIARKLALLLVGFGRSGFSSEAEQERRAEFIRLLQDVQQAMLAEVTEGDIEGASLDPLWLLGERIGSTLTDSHGRFEFRYEPSDFRRGDEQNRRLDLVLVAFAPEDSLVWPSGDAEDPSQTVLPSAAGPLSRILHLSFLGRGNAGREEAYVIRIAPEQIRRFGLDTGSGTLVSDIETGDRRDAQVQAHLAERAVAKLAKRAKVDSKVNPFIRAISTVSSRQRQSDFFISSEPGADRAPLVATAVTKARQQASIVFGAYRNGGPTLELLLGPAELANLGVIWNDPAARERGTFTLDPEEFCDFLNKHIGGAELIRVRDLLSEYAVQTELDSDEASGGNQPDPGAGPPNGDPDPVPSVAQLEELLRRAVYRRLEVMTADADDDDAPKSSLARLKDALEDFKPDDDPTKVVAFHDFHHLQVAFPDIWTEAFDQKLTDAAREAFQEYFEYKSDDEINSFDPGLSDQSDSDAFDRVMVELGLDLRTTHDIPIPEDVVEVFGVTGENWSLLSGAQQQADQGLDCRHQSASCRRGAAKLQSVRFIAPRARDPRQSLREAGTRSAPVARCERASPATLRLYDIRTRHHQFWCHDDLSPGVETRPLSGR